MFKKGNKIDTACLFCYILLFIITIAVAYVVIGTALIKLVELLLDC